MGKNSKKLRRQEYPNRKELHDWEDRDEVAQDEITEPVRPTRNLSTANNPYREGNIVHFSKVSGTVVQIIGDSVMVLDPTGLIHDLKYHQVSRA